jgi:enamine deaminase RidA (YjgF/YER057c/UK114 family)
MGAMFVKEDDSRNSFELLQSPLQCKAGDYFSMFSRAVRVREGLLKTVIISGTASIDISGQTLFAGDAMAQVEMTFEVMEKIAEAAGSDMRNILRGIAYLPNPYVREMFMTCCKRKNIETAAIMIIPGIVCRDNLLFELELDLV